MAAETDRLIVFGASSMVAHHLAGFLSGGTTKALFVSRSSPKEASGVEQLKAEPGDVPAALLVGADVISLMPLPATAAAAAAWSGVRGIVALGSTSRWVKQNSSDASDKAAAQALEAAEFALSKIAEARHLPVTVLRPTLVWDGVQDRNVTSVARFIHRFGFFPIAGRGRGGRQPIHAGDVARACLLASRRDRVGFCGLDLPGGQTLTYREMVQTIFAAMGRPDRTVSFPAALLTSGLALLRTAGLTDHSPSLFSRMNVDQVFDGAAAAAELGFVAGRFEPSFPWLV